MSDAASLLAFLAVVALVVAALGTSLIAFTLRNRFPEIWKGWGEPVEWLWLTRTSLGRHVFGFLDSRAYRASGDRTFILLCDVVRGGWYVGLILLPVAGLLLFFSLV
jgi:hypothetical protein